MPFADLYAVVRLHYENVGAGVSFQTDLDVAIGRIMADVLAGLAFLTNQPDQMAALQYNAQPHKAIIGRRASEMSQ